MGNITKVIEGLTIFRSKIKESEDGDTGAFDCLDALDMDHLVVRGWQEGPDEFHPSKMTPQELDVLDAGNWKYDELMNEWKYDLV